MAKSTDYKAYLSQLEDTLEEYLGKKAPPIPDKWKDPIVQFTPWLTLIFVIVGAVTLLGAFGISTVAVPFMMMGGFSQGLMYQLSLLVTAAALVIEGMSVPELLKKDIGGWRKLFYSTLLTLVSGILAGGGIIGPLIGALISLYILFQIKEKYS